MSAAPVSGMKRSHDAFRLGNPEPPSSPTRKHKSDGAISPSLRPPSKQVRFSAKPLPKSAGYNLAQAEANPPGLSALRARTAGGAPGAQDAPVAASGSHSVSAATRVLTMLSTTSAVPATLASTRSSVPPRVEAMKSQARALRQAGDAAAAAAAAQSETKAEDPSTEYDLMLRLRREVGDAIQSRFQPDRSKYYNLVKVVQECHPLPVEVLRGLSDNVSLIDTSCKSLLNALFAVKLHEHDREWMLAYSVFFENLVSAQACHLKAVAQHVTRLFCVYTRDATFDIVHNMIVTIVRLCPSGPKFLLPFVAKHFPFKDDPVPLVRRYVQHWLRLGRAIPLMRQPVFAILVRRLLSWDVELHSGYDPDKLDLDAVIERTVLRARYEQEKTAAEAAGQPFVPSSEEFASLYAEDMAYHAGGSDSEEDDDDKEHPAEALSRGLSHQDREEDEEDDEIGDDQIITTDLGQLFIRIDVFLTTLLEELRWLQKHLEETELEAFFTHSLSLLDEMVALRSSYTQYLWFFMASLHPNFANGMIGFLLMKFVDTDAHMSVRTGAASYLGSYLARAAYLPPAMLKMSARILMNWCVTYAQSPPALRAHDSDTPDFATPAESRLTKARIERHAVFYYAFQALIYTLCFHWRTLLLDEAMPSASESRRHDADADENEEEDEDDAASLRSEMPVLQEVMQSRLQPLRVCQKHVVDRFAKVVHGLEIFYVFHSLADYASPGSGSATPMQDGDGSGSDTASGRAAASMAAARERLLSAPAPRIDPDFSYEPVTFHLAKTFIDPLYKDLELLDGEDDEDDEDTASDTSSDAGAAAHPSSVSRGDADDEDGNDDEDEDDGETEGYATRHGCSMLSKFGAGGDARGPRGRGVGDSPRDSHHEEDDGDDDAEDDDRISEGDEDDALSNRNRSSNSKPLRTSKQRAHRHLTAARTGHDRDDHDDTFYHATPFGLDGTSRLSEYDDDDDDDLADHATAMSVFVDDE